MRDDKTKATADPRKTLKGAFLEDASIIVESWVISPNSAKNTAIKVEITTCQFICTSHPGSPLLSGTKKNAAQILPQFTRSVHKTAYRKAATASQGFPVFSSSLP